MKMRVLGLHVAGLIALSFVSSANATLIDRGNGMIYDSDQDLTWLKDANFAQSNGQHPTGAMDWWEASGWAETLVFGGFDDWRLPTIIDTGSPGNDIGFSGTDTGYNVDTSTSELAYMFHVNLSNKSQYNPDGSKNEDSCTDTAPQCLQNTSADGVEILNLQSHAYWSGTEYGLDEWNEYAWDFFTSEGSQHRNCKENRFFAWAVRSGDITTSVPEPTTLVLMLAGLIGMVGAFKKK